jgi:hypothetical protein
MWLKFLFLCGILSSVFAILSIGVAKKSRSLLVKTIALLKGFIFITLACGIFWVGLNLRRYEIMTVEKVLAEIECRKLGGDEMELIFRPADSSEVMRFILHGDQWMVGGDILRWERPVYLFGFNTLHKLTRISGRYLKTERETQSTHYALNGGTDRLWLLLYRKQRFFPFIEAVYGNATYTFPKENTLFKLYLTTSGYCIKEESLR